MRTILDDQNTIVVNAACCSDPGVICERCAAEAQQIANEDDDPPLEIPVCVVQNSYLGQADFWPADDDDVLPLPPSLTDILFAEKRYEQPERKPKLRSSFVINEPEEDPDLLPLPQTIY